MARRKDPAVTIRFPRDVLRAITARAKRNGRSRNSEIVVVLAQVIGLRAEQADVPPKDSQ